jgi:hypothetical protein
MIFTRLVYHTELAGIESDDGNKTGGEVLFFLSRISEHYLPGKKITNQQSETGRSTNP